MAEVTKQWFHEDDERFDPYGYGDYSSDEIDVADLRSTVLELEHDNKNLKSQVARLAAAVCVLLDHHRRILPEDLEQRLRE